jgi:AcrR family transcriptional regulator
MSRPLPPTWGVRKTPPLLVGANLTALSYAGDMSPDGIALERRPPYATNPVVGRRGQRTRERILDAALDAFDESGYHATSLDDIARRAGCSRVACYQYFTDKEDLFAHLADRVAGQVDATIDALDPIRADSAGWQSLRDWITRTSQVHGRYQAVFHSLDRDPMLAAKAREAGEATVIRLEARVEGTDLSPRRLDAATRLLFETLHHTLDVCGIVRAAAPDAYPADRVETAIADVWHRTLFGGIPSVNVHSGTRSLPLALTLVQPTAPESPTPTPTADAIVRAARLQFARRGYHDTRVDDIVAAAGVSRSAFYRHFDNKEHVARILTARAAGAVSQVFRAIPEAALTAPGANRSLVRRWLRQYHAAHERESGMLAVWTDATLQDPSRRGELASLLDWGRRRLRSLLATRPFGDADFEAIVFVAMLGVFGARPRGAAEVDAAVDVIERGLIGQ